MMLEKMGLDILEGSRMEMEMENQKKNALNSLSD